MLMLQINVASPVSSVNITYKYSLNKTNIDSDNHGAPTMAPNTLEVVTPDDLHGVHDNQSTFALQHSSTSLTSVPQLFTSDSNGATVQVAKSTDRVDVAVQAMRQAEIVGVTVPVAGHSGRDGATVQVSGYPTETVVQTLVATDVETEIRPVFLRENLIDGESFSLAHYEDTLDSNDAKTRGTPKTVYPKTVSECIP